MNSDLKHRIVQNILLNYSNLSFVDDTPFAWKIETLKQPFTLPVDCKYVDYYCRVVELCVRKYLRSIFNELGKDDYTELFINEGISNTAIRRTFIDHNEDYLWHVRPYDVGCCKFLALSSMVYGTDLKNLENLLDELPQIHDLRLVEILDNIKQYMFPNVGKELYDCRSSKSFIIKIEEENNSARLKIFIYGSIKVQYHTDICPNMPNIKLKSSDDDIFEIDLEAAKRLGIVSTALEHCGMDSINNEVFLTLAKVNSLVLRKILQWADYHKVLPLTRNDPVVTAWNANFLKINQDILLELIIAADYLDMQHLLQIMRENIEYMTKLTNSHDIFNIQNYSELKILHHALHLARIQCCSPESLKFGDTKTWGVITRFQRNGIHEVYGPTFEEIKSKFPEITSIENDFKWVITNVNRPFQTTDNEINTIYTERVLNLCIKKYICTIPDHTLKLDDFYTEAILGEGHLRGSLKQTFVDHYASFKYMYTPYDFASYKFLALSYLLQKNLIDDVETTIENLPKINEFTLATVLQNIEAYLSPFRKLRHTKIGTSRSLLIHFEVDMDKGHYVVIATSHNEEIISALKYEVLLFILSSSSNVVCNSITIYNPVIGKKYTTTCNINTQNIGWLNLM